MSWLVRRRSTAYRVRDRGGITVERMGPLHLGAPMLEWGSISKTVTARITERLAHAGIIDLSDPVSEYFPETQLPRTVDVLALATHTSGLPQAPRNMVATLGEARDPYAKYTNEYFDAEVLPTLAEQLDGTAGSFRYSNLGYAVLTRLLEVASGRDWWALAMDEVFAPLGISGVSISPDPKRVPLLRSWTGGILRQWTDTGPFIGAGGVHGTFDALEQYATAVAAQSNGAKPFGWMADDALWWHNGHNLHHGAFIGVSYDGSRVITVHTLGHRSGRADRIAARLERKLPLPGKDPARRRR